MSRRGYTLESAAVDIFPPPSASGRVGAPSPAGAPDSVNPIELIVFGAACYLFGVVSGAVVIPWLVDRGLFPVRRHGPCE